MYMIDIVENLVTEGKIHLRRTEALEATVHRLGDDRASLQTALTSLERVVGINEVILGDVFHQVEVLQAEQGRMQREMDHLRRTCYRGFKTATAGHFLKDELWDPPA